MPLLDFKMHRPPLEPKSVKYPAYRAPGCLSYDNYEFSNAILRMSKAPGANLLLRFSPSDPDSNFFGVVPDTMDNTFLQKTAWRKFFHRWLCINVNCP